MYNKINPHTAVMRSDEQIRVNLEKYKSRAHKNVTPYFYL